MRAGEFSRVLERGKRIMRKWGMEFSRVREGEFSRVLEADNNREWWKKHEKKKPKT